MLTSSGHVTITEGDSSGNTSFSVLLISNVSLSDNGTYTCVAENGVVSSDSMTLELTVLGKFIAVTCKIVATTTLKKLSVVSAVVLVSPTVPPSVTTFPEDSEVVIGNNITLTCSASGIHLPSVTWSRGGETIFGSSREIITQTVVNGTLVLSELIISDSEQRDTGNYSCSANNSAGVDTQAFHLQVLGMCEN